MSADAPTTGSASKSVGTIGMVLIVVGVILSILGAITYGLVTKTLSDQEITVSDDATHFAGNHVNTPWEAYSQALVINKHALESSGGKTYAQLPQGDPARDTVMNASFLQASLFTSVVAFGVAALVVLLGILLAAIGVALRKLRQDVAASTG